MPFVDVIAFHCPRCGRAVRLRDGARVVRCPSCSGQSLLLTRPPEPRFTVRPELGRRDAVEATKAFLRRPPNRPRLEHHATFHAPRLYYLPFHNATGRRIAIFHGQVPEVKRTPPTVGDRLARSGTRFRSTPVPTIEVTEHMDTRVQITDLNVWAPAFRSTRWDTTPFDLAAARLNATLEPLDLPRLQAHGTVVSVSVPIEETEARAIRADTGTLAVGVRRSTVFFPFWNVPYTVDGGRYEVLIAAAGDPGQVICGRAPADTLRLDMRRLEAIAAGLALGAGARAIILTLIGAGGGNLPGSLAALAIGTILALDTYRRRRESPHETLAWTGARFRRLG